MQLFCPSILALHTVDECQVVESLGRRKVLWPYTRLPNTDRPLIERFGLLILPLFAVEFCQVIERCSYVRMLLSQRLFLDAQGPLVERFCFSELLLVSVEASETIELGGDVWVVSP